MSNFYVGTSGWQYEEWLGKFYPEKMRTKDMLKYYGERFNTVEVNYTFNRLPTEKVLKGWIEQTPKTFRFTLKAHKAITHTVNLEPGDILERFISAANALGEQRGLLLFQYPPFLYENVPAFKAFLKRFPDGVRAAFEFRNNSWFCDELYAALKERNMALCAAESEKLVTPPVVTADYAYFRLRLTDYTDKDIAAYADQLRSSSLKESYVYFKHEEAGVGAVYAAKLNEMLKSK